MERLWIWWLRRCPKSVKPNMVSFIFHVPPDQSLTYEVGCKARARWWLMNVGFICTFYHNNVSPPDRPFNLRRQSSKWKQWSMLLWHTTGGNLFMMKWLQVSGNHEKRFSWDTAVRISPQSSVVLFGSHGVRRGSCSASRSPTINQKSGFYNPVWTVWEVQRAFPQATLTQPGNFGCGECRCASALKPSSALKGDIRRH